MKSHFLFVSFLVAVLFHSCIDDKSTAQNTSHYSKDSLSNVISVNQIIQRGKLIAITNNTPTSYFIYKGRPMGFEYDLLSDFSKHLGVELIIKIESSIVAAIDSVKSRNADILAAGLAIVGNRKEVIDFTVPILKTHQVLIQKKPDEYRQLSTSKLDDILLRDVTELAGKTVYVELGSAFYDRLIHLQSEIGDSINIKTYSGDIDLDSIIRAVSLGNIDYAIGDEYTARFFVRFYPNIDIKTPVSFIQNIAWAIPKNSTSLLDTLNNWISKNKNTHRWAIIYNKYFKYNQNMNQRATSLYTLQKGRLSPYDNVIKSEAQKIGWDWLLIAAQISVESGFNPEKSSWAGAVGLMQIMPQTAKGLTNGDSSNLNDPRQNIELGVKYNKILFEYWKHRVPDSVQAIKFALASYNIGKGHVLDAQRLAKKYQLNPNIWDDNVEVMLKNLSNPRFYQDHIVRHGYARGVEAYKYVNRIFSLYRNYKNFDSDTS